MRRIFSTCAFLLLVVLTSVAQLNLSDSRFQIELGLDQNERSVYGGIGFIYQNKDIQLKIEAARELDLLGASRYSHLNDKSNLSNKYTFNFAWIPKFTYFRPYFGFGVGYRQGIENFNNTIRTEWSAYLSNGFLIGNFSIGRHFLLLPHRGWEGSKHLELGYRLGLCKKQSPPIREYSTFYLRKILNRIHYRLYLSSSLNTPLRASDDGASVKRTLGFLKYFNGFLLGFEWDVERIKSIGVDKASVRKVYSIKDGHMVSEILAKNNNYDIMGIALFYNFVTMEKGNKNFEFGGGPKLFNSFEGYKRADLIARVRKLFDKEFLSPGLVLQGRLRYGPFSNSIDFNVPFGKFKPYLALTMNVGINIRRNPFRGKDDSND